MTTVNATSVSALDARDIRRYPNEIAKIPERYSVANVDIDRSLTFSEIASGIEEETPAVSGPISRKAPPERPFSLWEKEGFGFGDFVDIINPLQHIPIVATIYRNMTGDKIGLAPRVIGGAIWGRIGGFVSGILNAAVEFFTGKDVGDHIFSALFGTPSESGNAIAVAASVKPEKETTALESATDRLDLETSTQTASWQTPFAFEDPFAELTGHLTVPSIAHAVQSTQPEATSIAPARLSARDSYGRNDLIDNSTNNSKFRAVA